MSAQARHETQNSAAGKWDTIRYALDSTARTIRLCLIVSAISIPPALIVLLFRHKLHGKLIVLIEPFSSGFGLANDPDVDDFDEPSGAPGAAAQFPKDSPSLELDIRAFTCERSAA
jgi:hypothetical protein